MSQTSERQNLQNDFRPVNSKDSGLIRLQSISFHCALNGPLRTQAFQADRCLCWAHRSFCWFCRAAVYFYKINFYSYSDIFLDCEWLNFFVSYPHEQNKNLWHHFLRQKKKQCSTNNCFKLTWPKLLSKSSKTHLKC